MSADIAPSLIHVLLIVIVVAALRACNGKGVLRGRTRIWDALLSTSTHISLPLIFEK